jgi:flagellar hook-basal body complex protein FliE
MHDDARRVFNRRCRILSAASGTTVAHESEKAAAGDICAVILTVCARGKAAMKISASDIMSLRARILEQNNAIAGVNPPLTSQKVARAPSGFADLMQDAVTSVNAAQQEATASSAAYERGESTSIAELMLTRQKSSLAFQATLQVRNRLLSAYKDIMNMQL